MSRYIDADKLKQHYAWIRYADSETADLFDNIIDQQPTADVRENVMAEKVISKHGINDITTRWFECSICGQAVDLGDNFCKNCGANMKGS